MIWIEKKYANIIGAALRNFVWRTGDVAQFSCPYCGDSESDERKARGYFYLQKQDGGSYYGYVFHCHNCSAHRLFSRFLREQSETLYSDYRLEKFREEKGITRVVSQKETKNPLAHAKVGKTKAHGSEMHRTFELDGMICLENLEALHPAVQYVRSRSIPMDQWSRLFYTEDYKSLVSSVVVDAEKKNQYSNIPSDSRLVLPLRERDGSIYGFVGRRISESSGGLRYLTLKLDDDKTKIYGLERHKRNQTTYILEGAIDSLFLPNSLALCGGSISPSELEKFTDKENTIICLDNEPRHPDTLKRMKTFISAGFRVMIWKCVNEAHKDVNSMFEAGIYKTPAEIVADIERNSFRGMEAEVEFLHWKKL